MGNQTIFEYKPLPGFGQKLSATDKIIMIETEPLLESAESRVRRLMREERSPEYLFHNLTRILEWVELSHEFAEEMDLTDEEREVLLLATWFMATGYEKEDEAPWKNAARIARNFLEEKSVDKSTAGAVEALILSTGPEKEPESKLEKILHDVRWSWLGRKRFFGLSNLLRMEKENLRGESLSSYEWRQKARDMLVNTSYLTAYGRDKFLSRKIKNIAKQRKKLEKAKKKKIRQKTGKEFGRGVDTVYRVTFRNHINLSRIADGKANMIISINTVVLSVLITAGTASFTSSWNETLRQNWHLLLPVVVLMLTSLTAVVFAVLSALPKVSSYSFSEEDLEEHRISLLYFGNFLQLNEKKFVDYLRDLKKDQEILYDDLSRDLYNLGKVLRKKYRLLTIAYRVFVGGLALSMIILIVTAIVALA